MSNAGKVVDVHYHLVTPGLAAEVARCVPVHSRLNLSKNIMVASDGAEIPMSNEEEQLAAAGEAGVDTLVISTQSVAYLKPEEFPTDPQARLELSRALNDYLAALCRRYPGRVMGFADIPMVGLGPAAIDEMKRALGKLGLHGINLWTSYDGKHLDAPEFRPFLEEANRLKAAVFIHPTHRMEEALKAYHMLILVRYPCETTLTMARLAYSGALEQLSGLRFILSHAGGAIPFLWWRLDYGFLENNPTCRDHIKVPPTNFLKNCYYDTALCDADSLALACKRAGPGHMLFGTDFPYRTNAHRQTLAEVAGMGLDGEAREGVLGGNVLDLLGRG
ncbi:MAG: amidohydrolase [Chloroflexi bacterium]|nr:amidohydrolase [Chloroflexota bacterium]